MNNASIRTFFFSLLVYINCFSVLIVVGVPLLLFLIGSPRRWYVKKSPLLWLLDLFYKSILAAFMVPITVRGRKNFSLDEPSVIVANHQSLLDIFVVGSLFDGQPHIWYALSYYAHMPFFGFLVRHLVFAVDPVRPAASARDFRRGVRYAEKFGLHIALFPEGGRYNDGLIHTFMRGFALAARSLNRPVVPVCMLGNGVVYLPTAWRVVFRPIIVTIGEKIFISDQETDAEFVNRVRVWFEGICREVA